jgi:(1->4)-alpha-D-glucan 1-alpha-D-glucosylmutase
VTRPLVATYRLQLHGGYGFEQATALAEYLADLGVSHLYVSPIFQAAKGSTHGYDVVDHGRVNDELGGAEGYRRLRDALEAQGLGIVLDVVPNHMAVSGGFNAWWWDVLENGQSSRYASHFDVDWDPPEAKLRNVVLLPILGDHYGRVLEAGEIQIGRDDGAFTLRYHQQRIPVSPPTLNPMLARAARSCDSEELAFIADSLGALPLSTATDRESIARRHRDKEILRRSFARLCAASPQVVSAVDAAMAEVNRDPDALDALLEQQNYRLAYWRTAGRELGYRRFFDVTTLVGLRVEDERVFLDTHALVLGWLEAGILDGLRIDHPDGLRDPQTYLRRLRQAAPEAWIVVEKILEAEEGLPETWPVDGTTGYDFLNRVGGLFVDPAGEQPLSELYTELTGDSTDYASVALERKRQVMRDVLGSELNRLTALFVALCERHRRYRDYTRHELHEALRELIVSFPVYRTYVRAASRWIDPRDVSVIERAVFAAKAQRPDLDVELFDFLAAVLTLRIRGDVETELVMQFQQITGPAMAKGVEDTAFYVYNRLVSLNEVGGDPGRFGTSVEAFHSASCAAQSRWPRSMLTTSTHDTKRSEDVRARISLLSEIPERWRATVQRWSKLGAQYRTNQLPDRSIEYLLYQTLVGAWPIEPERVLQYMEKAAREAKTHTSWTAPNQGYEEALHSFVEGLLGDASFVSDLEAFVATLREPAWVTSLAQTLVKLTAPGVPDTYQGTELWDLSLVDPDNRRPVDFDLRRRLLGEMKGLTAEQIWARAAEGLPKLWVIRQALKLRQRKPECFAEAGDYRPLAAHGPRAAHVVAFLRGDAAVTVVPRLVFGLANNFLDTAIELPPTAWRNELTGELVRGGELRLAALLARFPVALLSREVRA